MASKNSDLEAAKKKVENLYGAALAKKASNRLLYNLSNAQVVEPESVPELQQPIILEFARHTRGKVNAEKMGKALRQNEEWSRLQNTLESLSNLNEGIMLQASQLLRQAQIKAIRDSFYQSVAAICNEIENQEKIPSVNAESFPHSFNKADKCWLNRSVKSVVEPNLMAEIAADNKILQIDLPRLLEAEISLSTKTVGAGPFRLKTEMTGKGIIVAVIDTEVNFKHPSLEGRVVQKENYTKEPWGNPGNHGTAVAGIIASNNERYMGVAPEATIYNYKVLATQKSLNADDFGGSLAIQQALEDGAHIANCSWGAGKAGDGTSREARACNEAWALGMTIVKSSGNTGPNSQTLSSPADADGIIVVGATDQKGISVQDYSSRGPTSKGKLRPHLVAPGGTRAKGIISCLADGGFGDCGCGTSYAAPHIAGILALLIQQNNQLMPDSQRDLLLTLCSEFDPHDANTHGKGIPSLARFSELL
jgi:serine protease AprX